MKLRLRVEKFLLVFCLSFFAVGATVTFSKVEAAVVRMVVATEKVVDPETGQMRYRVMNPKGEVDMTYTSSGALIQFTGTDGKPDAFKLTTSYPNYSPRETKTPAQHVYNQILAQTLSKSGHQLPATFLRNVSQEMAEKGQTLAVYFDRSRRMGFHIREFDIENVKIISGASSVSLAQAIFNVVSSNAKSQAEHVMREQQQMYEQAQVNRRTCEALFVSAP